MSTPTPSEIQALVIVMDLVKAGFKIKTKMFVDVLDINDKPIASIFPEDNYIQFHDEFTQIGVEIPVLKKFMDSGFNHNHS